MHKSLVAVPRHELDTTLKASGGARRAAREARRTQLSLCISHLALQFTHEPCCTIRISHELCPAFLCCLKVQRTIKSVGVHTFYRIILPETTSCTPPSEMRHTHLLLLLLTVPVAFVPWRQPCRARLHRQRVPFVWGACGTASRGRAAYTKRAVGILSPHACSAESGSRTLARPR